MSEGHGMIYGSSFEELYNSLPPEIAELSNLTTAKIMEFDDVVKLLKTLFSFLTKANRLNLGEAMSMIAAIRLFKLGTCSEEFLRGVCLANAMMNTFREYYSLSFTIGEHNN